MNEVTSQRTSQDIGLEVRRLRLERGMSQADLATASRLSGKSVQRVEAGRGFHADTLCKIACGLGLEPEDLASGADHPLDPLEPDYGARVRLRREELGLSLEEVARQCGTSAATLSRFERGRCVPRKWFIEWKDDAERTREAIVNGKLAKALKFGNARILHEFCMTQHVSAWLMPNGGISTVHLPDNTFTHGVPAQCDYPYRDEIEGDKGWYRGGRTRSATER